MRWGRVRVHASFARLNILNLVNLGFTGPSGGASADTVRQSVALR